MSVWKKVWPRTSGDQMSFVCTVVLIHTIVLFELFQVLPVVFADQPVTYAVHLLIGLFLYINVMCAFWYTLVSNSTTEHMMLPAILKQGWRFCSACEANAPARSFHCWTCDRCVLRRDHHCVFTGNCIGLNNARHFLTFVGYLTVGALYCNYLNMDYIWDLLGGFSFSTLISMFLPIVAWLVGFTKGFTLFLAIVSACCIFGLLLLVALLAYHGLNLYHGQVTYERSHNINTYNCGWRNNIKQVFGERWEISWFCSLINSPLPTDGLEFPVRGGSMDTIKNM